MSLNISFNKYMTFYTMVKEMKDNMVEKMLHCYATTEMKDFMSSFRDVMKESLSDDEKLY